MLMQNLSMFLFNTSILYGSYGNTIIHYNKEIYKIIGETVLKKQEFVTRTIDNLRY